MRPTGIHIFSTTEPSIVSAAGVRLRFDDTSLSLSCLISCAMDRKGPAHSAPYGQACLHCFKSKCKCVSRPGGEGCERCHRLNKQCYPSDSLRKRNAQKNHNSTARIAQLEGRLEGVVSLLQSLSKAPESSTPLRDAFEEENAADQGLPTITTPDSSPSIATGTNEDGVAVSSSCAPLASSFEDSTDTLSPPSEPSSEEAEAYLNLFRTHMVRYLAFVHIPPNMTASQLRREKPFLFRAILAVTTPTVQDKLARGRELKRIIAQTALLENKSSIDLLLGLLTYVAWSYDSFLTRSGTLSRLVILAVSLVGDLRLNKPVPPDVHLIGPFTPGFENCYGDTGEETAQRYLERQRAVLGCFLLSSIVSSYFAQMDAMRWTPQMEEGLHALATSKACPTDEAFAFQVRLQLLAQKSIYIREQRQEDNTIVAPSTATSRLPASMYVRSFHSQLQELRGSMSAILAQDRILIAHMHYIELCINETLHTANSNEPLLATPGSSPSSNSTGFERLECLWRSVNAIKSWLDIFYTLPPPTVSGCPFPLRAQLARCLVVLFRLSTLEDPAWDRQAVRGTVDLLLVLDQIATKLDIASRESGEQSGDEIFAQFSKAMRTFRAWAATKIAPEEPVADPAWSYAGTTPTVGYGMMDNNPMMMMDIGHDGWFEGFFAGPR
ncbi:putative C6 transcription factor [Hypoxylon sp. FL1150]|nr:putative C6 transcription factor [Hypoxylon sp. FL1150]